MVVFESSLEINMVILSYITFIVIVTILIQVILNPNTNPPNVHP